MKLLNRFLCINKFKVVIFKMKNKRNVHFQPKCTIDSKCTFEGKNLVCSGANLQGVKLGKFSYIGRDSQLNWVRIGRYSSIGPNVKNVVGKHPIKDFVSTHPAFFSIRKQVGETFVNNQKFEEYNYVDYTNKISNIIGNDVWIGANSSIMEGIVIGDGAVIAAGAVVTKNVPPFAIVAGIPAKIIKYRFNKEEIEFLLELEWWNKEEDWVKKYGEYFENIELLKQVLKNNEK